MHRDDIGAGKRFMQFQKFNVGIHRPVCDIGVYGDRMSEKRPGLVDEAALMRALDSGRISYCALDVLGTENFSESPLLHRENVILTPHISWCSEAALAELQKKTAQNVVETFLHGEPIYRAV